MNIGNVGVFYDSETVRFHLSLLKKISPLKDFTSFTNVELFQTSDLTCKIAVLHVPYPFDRNFQLLVNKLRQFCTHVYVIATEVHPEIVSFIQETDHFNLTFYICGTLNFTLQNAKVRHFLDWFETTTYFYREWLPEILTRLKPFEEKEKFFDILLGRKKLHRDQIFIHYVMGPDIGEIKYFNDTVAKLDDSDKWVWEGKGLVVNKEINWTIDKVDYYGYNMSLSQIIPIDIYNRNAYTAVAETCFHDNFSFFTEKTVKPILAKRLFIMFAGKHYLKNLRMLGFKTFGEIIDESYDEEADSLVRWKLAYNQMIWLSKQPQKEIFEKIKPLVEHNANLMLTTKWADNFRLQLEQDIFDTIAH